MGLSQRKISRVTTHTPPPQNEALSTFQGLL